MRCSRERVAVCAFGSVARHARNVRAQGSRVSLVRCCRTLYFFDHSLDSHTHATSSTRTPSVASTRTRDSNELRVSCVSLYLHEATHASPLTCCDTPP